MGHRVLWVGRPRRAVPLRVTQTLGDSVYFREGPPEGLRNTLGWGARSGALRALSAECSIFAAICPMPDAGALPRAARGRVPDAPAQAPPKRPATRRPGL